MNDARLAEQSVTFHYRFLGLGASAPVTLPPGELWIDVGNRVGPGVLDHHGGQTDARSSSELVRRRYREWLLEPLHGCRAVTLVLHQAPDLDAIGAAWLAQRIIVAKQLPEPLPAVETLVGAISAHDQGYLLNAALPANWPLVMRTRLDQEQASASDEDRLKAGMTLFDTSLGLLARGYTLTAVAEELLTPATRAFLESAQQDYQKDLARGTLFQLYLPIHQPSSLPPPLPPEPVDPPSRDEVPWLQCDGLGLEDPQSSLVKELAREDREHSPQRRGFTLLLVSRHVTPPDYPIPLYRHIISTDPRSGAYLQGLGKQLEALEQACEEQAGLLLRGGRERVAPGAGRHGYNVASPWYDGRGHQFTIVDSPSIRLDDQLLCASCLTPAQVLEAVRQYGKADGKL